MRKIFLGLLFLVFIILTVMKSADAKEEYTAYYNDGSHKDDLLASAYNVVNFEGNDVLRNMGRYENENILSQKEYSFENYSYEFKVMNHNTMPLPSNSNEINYVSMVFNVEGLFRTYYEFRVDYTFKTGTLYRVEGASSSLVSVVRELEVDVEYHKWHTYKVEVYQNGYEISLDGNKLIMGSHEESLKGQFGIKTQKSIVSIDDVKLEKIDLNQDANIRYNFIDYDLNNDILNYQLEIWIPKSKVDEFHGENVVIQSVNHQFIKYNISNDIVINKDNYSKESVSYFIYNFYLSLSAHQFSAKDTMKLITVVNEETFYNYEIVNVRPKTPKAWISYQTRADLELEWEDVGADYYDLYRSLHSEGPYMKIDTQNKNRVYFNANLTHNTTYYFKIIAKYEMNGEIIESIQETPYAFTPTDSNYQLSGLSNYILNWSDEFNGNALDTTIWDYRLDNKGGGSNSDNVSVRDGNLVITGRPYVDETGRKSGEGGGVASKTGFSYGYYEARIKVDAGKSWHAAFWTTQSTSIYNPELYYQNRFEIDIMEFDIGNWDGLYRTNVINWAPVRGTVGYTHEEPSDLRDSYYIWGCEYTPERLNIYLDGKLIQTFDMHNVPFAKHNIWLTMIHLTTEGYAEDPAPDSYMYVDYFRYYVPSEGIPTERLSKTEFSHHGEIITYDDFRSYSPNQIWATTENIRVLEGQFKLNQDGFEEDGKTMNITLFGRDIDNQISKTGLAHFINTNLDDYIVSANVRTHSILGENSTQAPNGTKNGIVGRLQDKDNYYYLQLDWNRNSLNLWVVRNGDKELLHTEPVYGELKTFNWYNLGLKFNGNQITAYFENEAMFTVEDDIYSIGTAGVRNELYYVSFDDFTVSEYVANESINVEEEILLEVSDTTSLNVGYIPSNTTDQTIKWESTNPNIASVSEDGNITALNAGITEIIGISSSGYKTKTSVIVTDEGYTGPIIKIPVEIELNYQNSISNDLTTYITNLESLINEGVVITYDADVNTHQYGVYPVTFTGTLGTETFSVLVNFKVVDHVSPSVEEISSLVVERIENISWEHYIQFSDNVDNDIEVSVIGGFNSNRLGQYHVSLIFTDDMGNQTRLDDVRITVIESGGPKFEAPQNAYVVKETEGFEIKDLIDFKQDTDPTLELEISGEYDLNTMGMYEVSIKITDLLGRSNVQFIKLHVVEDENPLIFGIEDMELSVNDKSPNYLEGLTVIDVNGNELPFTYTSNLDLTTAGTYTVTLQTKDFENRETFKTIRITVNDEVEVVETKTTYWPYYVSVSILLLLGSSIIVAKKSK